MTFKKGRKSPLFIDIVGQRFGRLIVLSREDNSKNGRTQWLCKCDCGNTIVAKGKYLRNGCVKSCGCLSRDMVIKRNKLSAKRNGESTGRIYSTWSNMLYRCYRDTGKNSKWYCDKGITVCDEWHSYKNFKKWALNNGFDKDLSIDRINHLGNYEPSNCRWVDAITQANNRSDNRYIVYQGERKTLMEWSRYFDINYSTLCSRLRKGCKIENLFLNHEEYMEKEGKNE